MSWAGFWNRNSEIRMREYAQKISSKFPSLRSLGWQLNDSFVSNKCPTIRRSSWHFFDLDPTRDWIQNLQFRSILHRKCPSLGLFFQASIKFHPISFLTLSQNRLMIISRRLEERDVFVGRLSPSPLAKNWALLMSYVRFMPICRHAS